MEKIVFLWYAWKQENVDEMKRLENCMKKTLITITIILCLAISGGYFVFDSIFPKAGPISGPTQNRANKDRLIKSISLTKKDGSSVIFFMAQTAAGG